MLIRNLLPNRGITILRYQSVTPAKENSYISPTDTLSLFELETQIQYLVKRYRILSLDAAVDLLKHHRPFPSNALVFTFDGGYADNFIAAQLLEKYGINATFFLATEPLERESEPWPATMRHLLLKTTLPALSLTLDDQVLLLPLTDLAKRHIAIEKIHQYTQSSNPISRRAVFAQLLQQLGTEALRQEIDTLILSWSQVYKMIDMGMQFGSYTLTSPNLVNIPPEAAHQEISASKTFLEKNMDISIRHFSYPNYHFSEYYNEQIKQCVIEADYESACTTEDGWINAHSNRFSLPRIETAPQLAALLHKLEWKRFLKKLNHFLLFWKSTRSMTKKNAQ